LVEARVFWLSVRFAEPGVWVYGSLGSLFFVLTEYYRSVALICS